MLTTETRRSHRVPQSFSLCYFVKPPCLCGKETYSRILSDMKSPSIATINSISHKVIGAAIEVHRELGPGLLESAYRECLAREFTLRGIPFEREKPIRLEYKGIVLEAGYRLDFLVAECLVVELKAIEALAPVHDAQLITYLRLGEWRLGLLINFNVPVLKNGIHRRILGYEKNQRAEAPEETHHDH